MIRISDLVLTTVANNFNTRSFTITHRVFVSVKILYQSERKHGFFNFPDYDPILGYSDPFNVLKSYCSEIQHRFLPAVHIRHTILS